MSPVLYRTHSFLAQFYPVVVVILDVFSEFIFEVIHIPEGARIELLRFHYAEEVLHHGVIQTVSLAAQTLMI